MFSAEFAPLFDDIGNAMDEELFNAVADEDGQCRFEELVSGLYLWGEGSLRDKLALLFDLFDCAPRNGTLNLDEVKQLVLCVSKVSQRVVQCFRRVRDSRTHLWNNVCLWWNVQGAVASTMVLMKAIGLQVPERQDNAGGLQRTASDLMLHVEDMDDYLPVLFAEMDTDWDGDIS